MNNTLFWARYIITAYITYTCLDYTGPFAGLIVFVVANALWTKAEETLINQRNIRETGRFRKNMKL